MNAKRKYELIILAIVILGAIVIGLLSLESLAIYFLVLLLALIPIYYYSKKVAEQTDISVITISKIEHDKVVNSDSFLRLLLFYSNYISADFLFAKDFNVADADNYTKSFSLNTIVKAKIEVIREEFEKELSKLKSEYIQKLTETANLL